MPEIDDETLVLYLDGELEPSKSQELEAILAREPELRERVSKLRMAWDMLDEIPNISASPNFAASTMEMIALSEEQETIQRSNWISKNFNWMVIALVPLAFLGSYFGTSAWQNQSDRQLLTDLPLLTDWRSLKNIDSIELLDILLKESQLVSAFADTDQSAMVGNGDVPATNSERRQWVAKLSRTDRDRLKNANEELKKTRGANELRKIANYIYQESKQSDHLMASVRAYNSLLQELKFSQREKLKDLPIAERANEINKWVHRRLAANYLKSFPKQDENAIRNWADWIVEQYSLFSPLDDSIKIVQQDLETNPRGSSITGEDLDKLVSVLSSDAQEILKGFKDPAAREHALIDWIAGLAWPPPPTTAIDKLDNEKLRKLYLELEDDRIDLLAPAQAQNEIRKVPPKRGLSEK
jgi:hypothetical protein